MYWKSLLLAIFLCGVFGGGACFNKKNKSKGKPIKRKKICVKKNNIPERTMSPLTPLISEYFSIGECTDRTLFDFSDDALQFYSETPVIGRADSSETAYYDFAEHEGLNQSQYYSPAGSSQRAFEREFSPEKVSKTKSFSPARTYSRKFIKSMQTPFTGSWKQEPPTGKDLESFQEMINDVLDLGSIPDMLGIHKLSKTVAAKSLVTNYFEIDQDNADTLRSSITDVSFKVNRVVNGTLKSITMAKMKGKVESWNFDKPEKSKVRSVNGLTNRVCTMERTTTSTGVHFGFLQCVKTENMDENFTTCKHFVDVSYSMNNVNEKEMKHEVSIYYLKEDGPEKIKDYFVGNERNGCPKDIDIPYKKQTKFSFKWMKI